MSPTSKGAGKKASWLGVLDEVSECPKALFTGELFFCIQFSVIRLRSVPADKDTVAHLTGNGLYTVVHITSGWTCCWE